MCVGGAAAAVSTSENLSAHSTTCSVLLLKNKNAGDAKKDFLILWK